MKYGRAHWLTPDEMNEPQRELYNVLTGGRRLTDPIGSGRNNLVDAEGRLYGPQSLLIMDPALGVALHNLGSVLRFGLELSPRLAELCILETALYERSNVEWPGHSDRARKLGISDEDIQAIRSGTEAPGLSDHERLVRRICQSILRHQDISDELFDEAERSLGPTIICEVTALISHYKYVALSLRIWRIPSLPWNFGEPLFE